MQRSRLRNIVNKAKELNTIKDPFDSFKNSLPIGLDYYKDGGKYRLKAAWEAYGKPKDFKEARWNGLIETFDGNNFIMPSIGYNSEKDSYEYLNIGKENEIVNKDLRAWDNDVIPFIKELKYGGYIKKFNEEEGYWSYVKEVSNPEEETELLKKGEVIDSFLKGGKPKFEDWYKTVPQEKSDTTNYDLEKAYNELPFEKLELFRTIPEKHLDGRFKKPNHMTYSDEGYGWIGSDKIGWTFYPSPRQLQLYPYEKYVEYWNRNEPNSILNYNGKIYKVSPQVFKQGGQMNVIPEGALHARKNNMEGAGEDFTAKGIPVVDNNGEQLAEIEKEEWTMTKELTDDVEKWYKEYYKEDTSQKDKDELAIKCGKRITKELLHNTDDRANLITKMLGEEE